MKPEEKELIDRLYFEMYDALVSYANSYLNDQHRAEELTQEVFVSAVCKPEALLSCPNPKGWLYKTMKNMLQNNNRVTSRQMKLIADFLSVNGKEIAVSVDQPDLMLQYGELAETEEFKLIYDMAVLGKSQQELSAERNITLVCCKKRVERAKKYLRRKFSK
jgi:DNA-directed RNA polymerase specialized sigma24 family protein